MSDLHDALALAAQRAPGITEIGSYKEPKPQSGVCVEAISVASLFPPNIQTPWFLGGKEWQIKPDEIPLSITDENCKLLVTKNNRTGGQLIRIHDFAKNRSGVSSFFGSVGVTEFLSLRTKTVVTPGVILKPGKDTVVTPGVNLKVDVTPIEGPAGQASLAVGANQGSLAKVIGETQMDPTPENKFRIETTFVPPTKENAGLLLVAINRTQFPHLMLRDQIWGPDTKSLADVKMSLPPTYDNPFALMLPTEMRTFYYELKPDTEPKNIDLVKAKSIADKHEQGADSVNLTLARIQKVAPYVLQNPK